MYGHRFDDWVTGSRHRGTGCRSEENEAREARDERPIEARSKREISRAISR